MGLLILAILFPACAVFAVVYGTYIYVTETREEERRKKEAPIPEKPLQIRGDELEKATNDFLTKWKELETDLDRLEGEQ